MNCFERLLSRDNLYVAYLRARRSVEDYEGLVDREEVARWEGAIDLHLAKVRRLLVEGPRGILCRLVPIPKAEDKLRAYYSIPLEYQVGWAAIVQVLGRLLDPRMPSWSFAYRLHRPKARVPDDTTTWLWDGYLLHSSSLYLGFAQSWKPFRRYANLTVRRMLGAGGADDPREAEILAFEAKKAREHKQTWMFAPYPKKRRTLDLRHFPFPYMVDDWRPANTPTERVWFSRLDLSKFFPSIQCTAVHSRLLRELADLDGFDEGVWSPLLRRWLLFEEDARGIARGGLSHLARERVTGGGLPVGLVASGFLANVFMMEVDRAVERELARHFRGRVAVLRYVDDYVILAEDRNASCRWLARQIAILKEHGLELNDEKIRPAQLAHILSQLSPAQSVQWLGRGGRLAEVGSDSSEGAARLGRWRREGSVTRLDRKEFVSTALQRMSQRADEDVDLLDDDELDARVLDLADLAETAEDHQEIRADTVEAFSAAQLQRTPLYSPSTTLAWAQLARDRDETARSLSQATDAAEKANLAERHQRAAAALVALQEGAMRRIGARSDRAVRHVLGSLIRNPHKHRLFDRWVQTAAAAAELRSERFPFERDAEALAALLAGKRPPSGEYEWNLSDREWRALNPAVLSFLRMRMWSALAACAESSLASALLPRTTSATTQGMWPTLELREERRLAWLLNVAQRLRTATDPQRRALAKRQPYVVQLEGQAVEWWELWARLAASTSLRGNGFASLWRASGGRYEVALVFALRALVPLTKGRTPSDDRSRAAHSALAALATRVSRLRRRANDLEHRVVRAWLMQDPEARSRSSLIRRLFASTRSEASYVHDSEMVGWISDFAWTLASTAGGARVLRVLAKARLPLFDRFLKSVLEPVRRGATTSTVSLQGLLVSRGWFATESTGSASSPSKDLHEAIRIAMLRGVLARVASALSTHREAYLSPNNWFISRRDWDTLELAVNRGEPPATPWLEYRPVLRDPLYLARPDPLEPHSVSVASGLCGIALVSGRGAIRRLSRRGVRSRLVLSSVWDALETGPALSRELVRTVGTLCASAHLESLSPRLLAAYAGLFGTPAAGPLNATRLIKASRRDLATLSEQLAKASTIGERGALYVIAAGFPEPAGALELAESLDVTIVQIDLDLFEPGTWSNDDGAARFAERFVAEEAWPHLWRALRAVRAAAFSGPELSLGVGRPRIVVLPELAIPHRYVRTVRRFAQAHDIALVGGVEYRVEQGSVANEALVALPAPERHGGALSRLFWVGKHYPAIPEAEMLHRRGLRFVGASDFVRFQHPSIGSLGVALCYDLYSVKTLAAFQRRILHLVVPAYNRDLTTFDGLSDAAMRLLFANVILANTGHFGGSLVVAPFYEVHHREVLRIRGQHIDTVQHGSVPLAGLEFERSRQVTGTGQRASKPPLPKRFKTRPADW